MIIIPEMIPSNDNNRVNSRWFSWKEFFIAVACSLLAIGITSAGLYSLIPFFAGL
jgi:hypothetical protein